MSRPSRGFRVDSSTRGPTSACPTTGTTSITQQTSTDWFIDFGWTPAVTILTASIQYRVNGGGWDEYESLGITGSSWEEEVDPYDVAGLGDFLEWRLVAIEVAGCPEFITVPAGATLE
jgi:hypothetical protein